MSWFSRLYTLPKSRNSLSDILGKDTASAIGSTIRGLLHEAAASALVSVASAGLQDAGLLAERVTTAATNALSNVSPLLSTEIQKVVGPALDKALDGAAGVAADRIPIAAASVAEAVAGLLKV